MSNLKLAINLNDTARLRALQIFIDAVIEDNGNAETVTGESNKQIDLKNAIDKGAADHYRETGQPEPETAKPATKRAPAKKATPAAKMEVVDPVVETGETETEEPEEVQETKADSGAPKIEDIRLAVAKKSKNPESKEKLKAKLSELGAANVSSLDPKHFADFLELVNSLPE